MTEPTTPLLLRCLVCSEEKPPDEFPVDGKRRSGRQARCCSCAADFAEPDSPVRRARKAATANGSRPRPAPPRHYCRSCRSRILTPGKCGFCIEEQTGESLTDEGLEPVLTARGPEAHRMLVARLAADEPGERPNTGSREVAAAGRCIRGHLLEGDNVGSGGRCLECERQRKRQARADQGAQPDYGRRREAAVAV